MSGPHQDTAFITTNLNKRALIIANDDYNQNTELNKLSLCEKDGKLVERTLRQYGFETVPKYNLTNEQIYNVVHEFAESLDPDYIKVALVYYCGHSMETTDKKNFLFGVDAQKDDSGYYCGISLQQYVQRKLQGDWINIFILDACRTKNDNIKKFKKDTNKNNNNSNNSRQEQLLIKGRYSQRQNQTIDLDLQNNWQIIYACMSGKAVFDDPKISPNGFYAQTFCESMKQFQDWDTIVRQTKSKTKYISGGRQIVISEQSLCVNFRLYEQQQQQLREQLQSGYVEDECFDNLNTNFNYSVVIRNDLTVRNAIFKSQNVQCAYLEIKLDGAHQVTFEDCEFEGVGLRIISEKPQYFDQLNEQVTISNTTIKNSPQNGLQLYQVMNPVIENTNIISSRFDGCIFTNCGLEGWMWDCLIQGSKQYGVNIKDTTIKSTNVQFCDNSLNVKTNIHGSWQVQIE